MDVTARWASQGRTREPLRCLGPPLAAPSSGRGALWSPWDGQRVPDGGRPSRQRAADANPILPSLPFDCCLPTGT